MHSHHGLHVTRHVLQPLLQLQQQERNHNNMLIVWNEIMITVFDFQDFSLVVSGCFGGSGNDIDMSDTVYQSEVTQSVDSFNVLTGVVQ